MMQKSTGVSAIQHVMSVRILVNGIVLLALRTSSCKRIQEPAYRFVDLISPRVSPPAQITAMEGSL